jgi:hypothetical protein
MDIVPEGGVRDHSALMCDVTWIAWAQLRYWSHQTKQKQKTKKQKTKLWRGGQIGGR